MLLNQNKNLEDIKLAHFPGAVYLNQNYFIAKMFICTCLMICVKYLQPINYLFEDLTCTRSCL